VLTLGIDLSTEPRGTAACLIEWPEVVGKVPTIALVRTGVTDDDVLALASGVEVVAIDAPFGWPREWAAAVAAHRPGQSFFAAGLPSVLTRRAADGWIASNVGIYPLAVAANLIGATAIRCARLVHRLGVAVDTGRVDARPFVSEVYPAAALKRWGLSYRLYKGRALAVDRSALIDSLVQAGLPVALQAETRRVIEASDDALDGLLCSLVARAVAIGLTDDAPEALLAVTATEGWIRVPRAGSSLRSLGGPRMEQGVTLQ